MRLRNPLAGIRRIMTGTEQHTPDHTHDHEHTPTVDERNERRVLLALGITLLFLLTEAIGGLLAGSLVLLADAGHMLVDAAALGLAWFGFRIARRPADPRHSYGYHRFAVLAAFINGIALFFISAGILYEAVQRLLEPSDQILGGLMLAVSIAGLAANIVSLWLLSGGKDSNINMRSAALHVLGDLLGSVAAIAAAIVITLTQWTPIDPILSVLVCVLILGSAWKIVRNAGHILMQGTPADFDAEKMQQQLKQRVPELIEVHQVHVWALTEGKPVLSLHARVQAGVDFPTVLARLKRVLRDDFDLPHSVVQLESAQEQCPD